MMYRLIFLLLVSQLAITNQKNQTKNQKAVPPNVIILFCDDMGYGDMGNTGHPTIRTPHLDRLAMDGVRLSNFYSASPACTASRYALLTGRYPIRSGFSWVLYPKSVRGIHAREVTIAEMLKEKGYATACYGKWHLGSTQEAYLPLQNGFDEYLGLPYSNDMIPPQWPDIPLMEGNDTLELNPDQTLLTKMYTERALDFINRHQEGPFFLYMPYAMPHVPLHPGEDFAGKSLRGAYGDVIEEIDWSVGQIRSQLEKQGLAENTLLVFTSDNGPWIIKNELGGSSGLFRDGKGSTWEGGMRVPGLVYWKGKTPEAAVLTQATSTIDLLPTIAAITGANRADALLLDGKDLSDLLFQQQATTQMDRPYFYYGLNNQLFAVRQGPWKMHIKTYSQTGVRYFEKDPPLLFNVEVDPSEKYELSQKYPEKVQEMLELIDQHLTRLAANPGQYWPAAN